MDAPSTYKYFQFFSQLQASGQERNFTLTYAVQFKDETSGIKESSIRPRLNTRKEISSLVKQVYLGNNA